MKKFDFFWIFFNELKSRSFDHKCQVHILSGKNTQKKRMLFNLNKQKKCYSIWKIRCLIEFYVLIFSRFFFSETRVDYLQYILKNKSIFQTSVVVHNSIRSSFSISCYDQVRQAIQISKINSDFSNPREINFSNISSDSVEVFIHDSSVILQSENRTHLQVYDYLNALFQ